MSGEARARYLAEFARVEAALPGNRLPWLRTVRAQALERYAELGFPTTREEDWKYTNVMSLENRPFSIAAESPNGVGAEQVQPHALEGCHLLVFVDGRFVPGLSRLLPLPSGARLGSLAAAIEEDSDRLEPVIRAYAETAANGFAALNAAFLADGAYIALAPGVAVEEPIHLLFFASRADACNQPHNVVLAGAGSRASIVEQYLGLDGEAYFTNATTQVILERGAQLTHYKLQQEAARAFHIGAIHVSQGESSRLESHSYALGAWLSRTDICTRMDAEGCEATLNGLYLASGRQHVDHHTRIDHARPRGTSREFYKGVLDGASRGVFNGKVVVHRDAQQTDAHQSNRNLLLSENAEVDTKPQLEIYADDVKCTHGATVGQLDENQVFYLRSRGVDDAAARVLLTYAFAKEIIARAEVAPLRARLDELLLNRLPQGQLVRKLL